MAATKLLPAYLIIGTDELKRNRAVTRMKQRLEASGLADFNLDERDMGRGEADPEDLLSRVTHPERVHALAPGELFVLHRHEMKG